MIKTLPDVDDNFIEMSYMNKWLVMLVITDLKGVMNTPERAILHDQRVFYSM